MSFLGLALDVAAAAVVIDVAGHFACAHCGATYKTRERAYSHAKTHTRRKRK